MKKKEKLLADFAKAKKLLEQAEKLRTSVDIDHDNFGFCYHTAYDIPHFSAWLTSLTSGGAAEFEVKDGDVFVSNVGRYDDETIQEMKQVIEDWLNDDE